MTKEQQNITFNDSIRWIEHGIFCDMVRLDILQLNDELERICNAALLSRNVNEAYMLITGFLTHEQELSPTNQALLRSTHSRLSQLAEAGGWLPVRETETEQDTENCFPKNTYPDPIESYLKSVAQSNQTATEMPFAAALAAFALSLQGRCTVAYPSGNSHTEHLCLYMGIIAEPSERKSPTFRLTIRKPFHKWRKEKQSEYKEKLSEYKAKRKILENQLSGLQKKCNGAEVSEQVEADIVKLQKELDALGKPVSPHFLLDDTTPEALGKRMLETGESAGIFSDEGCFLQTLAGRYSDGSANIDLPLKSYSGEYTTINRITREDIALERPLLSICLALQPSLFDEFVGNKTLRDRGLVARFIFCKPAPMAGFRDAAKKTSLDLEGYSVYEQKLHKFLDTPQLPDEDISVIQWESTAAAMMLEYLQQIEDTQKPEGIMSNEKAYAGKAGGAAVRIAGILHMMWTENASLPISRETAYRAICVHKYFFAEKIKDMQQAESREQKQALAVRKRLLAMTVQESRAYIPVRDAYMKLKGSYGLRAMQDFDNVLELLCAENIIDVTSGRKRLIYISPYWEKAENVPTIPTLQ